MIGAVTPRLGQDPRERNLDRFHALPLGNFDDSIATS